MEIPEDKIVIYQAYDTVMEANIAKTKLDAYGIPCFLTEENLNNLYPFRNDLFPGVRLFIFENDRDRVREVLTEENPLTMLRYFPFSSTFDLKMGTSALPVNHSIVEIDENYLKEIKLKRKLLSTDHSYYYQSSTVTEKAQWEVVDKILFNLSNSYPDKFTYTKSSAKSQFENKLLKEKVDFAYGDTSTLDMEPMDWVGRQIQEDLLLLDTASILRSGQLCFPSGWDIQSKFEKHFLELHAPLPKLMEPMLQAADKLIERIPFGKPIARTNWGFRITDQLDLSTRRKESYSRLMQILVPKLTIENTGDKIFVRSERQTLSRLSESGFVLFTIHTYNSKVMEETQDIHRAKAMLTFLQGAPPELIEYKVMTPFLDILMSYLKHASE